jgi:hypothetical protein
MFSVALGILIKYNRNVAFGELGKMMEMTCNCKALAREVQARIYELKSEQVGLKPFIQSDQVLWEALERAIEELTWVLNKLKAEEE